MNNKIVELKDAIYQLYCKEGRSAVYISKLFKINRKNLGLQLKEWKFEKLKVKRITPANKKLLNKYKSLILSRLKNNISLKDISTEIKISYIKIQYLYKLDNDLVKAVEEYKERLKQQHVNIINNFIQKSNRNYEIQPLEGEVWKPILGYEEYEISNKGRVKHLATGYNKFYLLSLNVNQKNNRLYVTLCNNNNNKKENLQVARLVGFNFCNGYSKINNTINHKDGNVQNNDFSNLEWVSQSDNNLNSYRILNRKINKGIRGKFIIVYKNKFTFKTVAAFARFINKSETQIRRYLETPEKYNIKIIKKLV